MSHRLLIENATVVTVDPDLGDLDRADILLTDGRITAVGTDLGVEDAERVDASARIVLPGFVDTHRHTWQSAIRHSYGDVDPLTYFADVLGTVGPTYTADDVRIGTELGAVAALSAGTTTLMDWAHIQNTPEHTQAGIDALASAGGRAVFGYGWPLTSDGRWTQASSLGHPQEIGRLREDRFASDDGLLTLAMAARGPEVTTPEVWRGDLLLARELGIRTSVHVGAYAHNARHHAVSQYAAAGLIAEDMTFVHCGNSTDAEISAIGDAGATVSLGVHCELNSAGIGDIPLDRLLHRGIQPSLSGDTETKCAGDMFTQMRMLFGYYRSWIGGGHSQLAEPPDLTLRDVLEFATIQGARALGLADRIGSITPGKQADLVFVRATDLNLAPVADPVAALVLAAHEGNVDAVMVNGRFAKRAGHMCADVQPLIARAASSHARLIGELELVRGRAD
jgi:5-methylthioadenosine/S-adenosylhomocysteine deaminase